MTDEQSTDPALNDAVRSIRQTGENADTAADPAADTESTDAAGEPNPNPPLPDWGTDGIPDE